MFEGENLLDKSDAEMRRVRGKRIAMILQDPMASLNPLFSIGNQVGEPIRVHEGASRAQRLAARGGLLKSVRIASPETRVSQFPHEMSGGMRQRIVGAIGISCEPRLLIADEPTTSLDLTIQAQYLNLLRDLQREHGLALIFITHNLGIVAKMCDQLAVMYAGRVVEQGPVSRIFTTPAHPYTKALLGSIPRMTDDREQLTAIEGQPPDLASLPPGCAFAPRCPAAFARCRAEAPPEFALERRPHARCWLAAPDTGTRATTRAEANGPTIEEQRDAAVVEDPTYDRSLIALRRHGAEAVPVTLEADGVDVDALRAALDQHPAARMIYVIPTFQNPAGVTLSATSAPRWWLSPRSEGCCWSRMTPTACCGSRVTPIRPCSSSTAATTSCTRHRSPSPSPGTAHRLSGAARAAGGADRQALHQHLHRA